MRLLSTNHVDLVLSGSLLSILCTPSVLYIPLPCAALEGLRGENMATTESDHKDKLPDPADGVGGVATGDPLRPQESSPVTTETEAVQQTQRVCTRVFGEPFIMLLFLKVLLLLLI